MQYFCNIEIVDFEELNQTMIIHVIDTPVEFHTAFSDTNYNCPKSMPIVLIIYTNLVCLHLDHTFPVLAIFKCQSKLLLNGIIISDSFTSPGSTQISSDVDLPR